jgi:murein DD-endopeptidase MepM/ murein hydrolase activator NlpD
MAIAALSLLLVAAGEVPARPEPSSPGPSADPTHHDSIAPGYWLSILPAPATTPGQRPSLQWPLHAPMTQAFGCTGFGLEPTTTACPAGYHTGIDLAAPSGTPVRAAADGIAYALPDYEIYGNHVVIAHAGGVGTVYAHLSSISTAWGQRVRTGDVIGYVGSTGNSTGPHLHFEVRYAGAPVDPLPWLDGKPLDLAPVPAGWPGLPSTDDTLGLH